MKRKGKHFNKEYVKQDNVPVFEPINQSQIDALSIIHNSYITFLLGPAGTAKTHTATAYAIQAAYNKEYNNIVFTRPVVEANESLGFLPGSIDEKLAPYMVPLNRCADKVGRKNLIIETMPIAYLRGVTFENCITILDEAQNCTRSQLKLYLTRYGKNSKMIICGDLDQADIKASGLFKISEDLKDIDGISVFYFKPEDTVRHPLVQKITARIRD